MRQKCLHEKTAEITCIALEDGHLRWCPESRQDIWYCRSLVRLSVSWFVNCLRSPAPRALGIAPSPVGKYSIPSLRDTDFVAVFDDSTSLQSVRSQNSESSISRYAPFVTFLPRLASIAACRRCIGDTSRSVRSSCSWSCHPQNNSKSQLS